MGRQRPEKARTALFLIVVLVWLLASCGTSSNSAKPGVTFPPGPPDLVVKFNPQATRGDLEQFSTSLNLQARGVTAATKIDAETLTVYVYFRPTSQPEQQQELRTVILRSPLVISASPP